MKISNEVFKDYPIEFKEINPSDFLPVFEVENNRKVIITPNPEGYINDEIQNNITLDTKNTVVINAAVGQGKSYAIIKTIKRYYLKEEKYLIIVASPFVSLVRQYCLDINKDADIPTSEIFNYNELGRNPNASYIGKSIQVLTVNTLLGNPGQDGFKNSDIKRKYLNEIIQYCKDTETKVIFIYDEIHDSYQNFREEYIFNLWKWKNVIQKNFIISATYNEASKVVIEYLAELTDKRIKIIESERIRFENKQSTLHLYYSPSDKFTTDTLEIKNTIKKLVEEGKNIDVLCYSKSLANKIFDKKGEIGKFLRSKYQKINKCTSELISKQRPDRKAPTNQFNNNYCNIGTNFKTGVSIKKRNHAYIIILPPRATRLTFGNRYGIFSGGVNSVIQALARQRLKGEIHIILPRPDRFDYTSLNKGMSSLQKKWFKSIYDKIKHSTSPEYLVQYLPFKNQDTILKQFYDTELLENIINEKNQINQSNRDNLPSLKFPKYKQFKLEKGERFLANDKKNPFFGEDISAYVSYASLTNQFINCKLKEIHYKPTLYFKEGEIQQNLKKYYNQYFGTNHYRTVGAWGNFPLFYSDIKYSLFNKFEMRLKTNLKWKNIILNSSESKVFEIQLLNFVANLYYGVNYIHTKELFEFKGNSYNRGTYFLDCIKLTENINLEEVDYEETLKSKVRFYHLLDFFRKKISSNIQLYNKRKKYYLFLPNKPWEGLFNEDDFLKFEELKELIKYDYLLKNNIFEYQINLTIELFYKKLINDFLSFNEVKNYPKIMFKGKRQYVKKIISSKALPYSIYTINTVEPKSIFEYPENYIIETYGSISNYYKFQNELTSLLN